MADAGGLSHGDDDDDCLMEDNWELWTVKLRRDEVGSGVAAGMKWMDTGEVVAVFKTTVVMWRAWSRPLGREFCSSLFCEPAFYYSVPQVGDTEENGAFSVMEWMESQDKPKLFYANRNWMKGLGASKGRVPYPYIAHVATPKRIDSPQSAMCVVLSNGEIQFVHLPRFRLEGGQLAEIPVKFSTSQFQGFSTASWAPSGDTLALGTLDGNITLWKAEYFTDQGETKALLHLLTSVIVDSNLITAIVFVSPNILLCGFSNGKVKKFSFTDALSSLQSQEAMTESEPCIPISHLQVDNNQAVAQRGNQVLWWHNIYSESKTPWAGTVEYNLVGSAWTGENTIVVMESNARMTCWKRTKEENDWTVRKVISDDGEEETPYARQITSEIREGIFQPVLGMCASPCGSAILMIRFESKTKFQIKNQRIKGVFANMYAIPVRKSVKNAVVTVVRRGKPYVFYALAWCLVRYKSMQIELTKLVASLPDLQQPTQLNPNPASANNPEESNVLPGHGVSNENLNHGIVALTILMRASVNDATVRQQRSVLSRLAGAVNSNLLTPFLQDAQWNWTVKRLEFFLLHKAEVKNKNAAPFALILADLGLSMSTVVKDSNKVRKVRSIAMEIYREFGTESDQNLAASFGVDTTFPTRSTQEFQNLPKISFDQITFGLMDEKDELDVRDVRTMEILFDSNVLLCTGCGCCTGQTQAWFLPESSSLACILCGLPMMEGGVTALHLP